MRRRFKVVNVCIYCVYHYDCWYYNYCVKCLRWGRGLVIS